MLAFTANDIIGNPTLAANGLQRLKDVFAGFINNTQPVPLVYDSYWRGIVSSSTYSTGNDGDDFGNTLYNDHHFHYGYHVYTAAVIGYLDPSWLKSQTNVQWVSSLIRDFANPVENDQYYPFSRSFDWFHGHSWAKGLFASLDGKDEESSSEDAFAMYAIKMWARVIHDQNMESRANLQLALMRRSFRNYFLMEDNNANQPSSFVPNKVTGIVSPSLN
jgi:endo-1,3(4)-beta-glucanase